MIDVEIAPLIETVPLIGTATLVMNRVFDLIGQTESV
jgi:hypothetical protein